MLTKVDVVYENESGDQALELPILGVTPKDSLLVRKITGLNPPDIDLFIGDYSRDGGIFTGRRVAKRNPVITLDLNPNPALGESISGLRKLLYKTFIDPQINADYFKLVMHDDDGKTLYLIGYTEKFETEPFDVETMVQISIICPDPYIRDVTETVLTSGVGWTELPFTYGGTAESGLETEIYVSATTSVLTFEVNGRTMIITYPFVNGDVVYINTNRGQRDILKANAADVTSVIATYPELTTVSQRWAKLQELGDTSPLIAKLSSLSRWIELHLATNTLKVYGVTTANLPATVRTLAYRATYWGV